MMKFINTDLKKKKKQLEHDFVMHSNSGHLSSFTSVAPSVRGVITTRAARLGHICLQYLSYWEDSQQESLTFLFHPSLEAAIPHNIATYIYSCCTMSFLQANEKIRSKVVLRPLSTECSNEFHYSFILAQQKLL